MRYNLRKEDAPKDCSVGVSEGMPWQVVSCRPLEGYRIWIRFKDGTEGIIDLESDIMAQDAGVFEILRDPIVFRQVSIVGGALTWPGGIDIAPDAMYDDIINAGDVPQ